MTAILLSWCGVVSTTKYDEVQYELNNCQDQLQEANDNIDEANSTIEDMNSQIEDAQSYVWWECYDLYDMESIVEGIYLWDTVSNVN